MKQMAIILALFVTIFAKAADTANVTAVIESKRIEFNSNAKASVVESAIDLLGSCGYMNDKPNRGARAEPESMADAQRKSHVHLVFSKPRHVELPLYKTTLQAREIVITLPLSTAGIWVRTSEGVTYFSKFRYSAGEKLKKLIDEAQKR